MEILLFLLSFVVIPPAVSIYRRTLAPIGAPHPGFEAWCGQRPMIAAVFLPGGVGVESLRRMEGALYRAVINTEGPFPFAAYELELDVVRWGENVLSVHVRGCRLRRGTSVPPFLLRELLPAVQKLADERGVEELWLHGALYRGEELRSLDDSSWRVRVAPRRSSTADVPSGIAAHAYRELPFWLRRRPEGPPRDGRAKSGVVLFLAGSES